MNAAQIKKARVLLAKADITDKEDKEAMVLKYTDGRTTHLSQMTQEETVRLFAVLSSPEDASRDRMVSKMMAMARDMGWTTLRSTTADRQGAQGDTSGLKVGVKADAARVNAWAVKHTPYHKELKALTVTELTKVVSLFEKVYGEFLGRV